MAYGLRYKIEWKSAGPAEDILYFHIFMKDYAGDAVTELIGDGSVCEIEYPEDNPFAPFRTSSCRIRYRNENNIPLATFYSEDDEMYLGKLIDASDGSTRWAGFMVQDECSEAFAPVPYVVDLTFTDNLALLKEIPYNEALVRVPDAVYDYQTRTGVVLGTQINIVPASSDFGLQPGDVILVDGVEHTLTEVIFHPSTPTQTSYLELKVLNSPGNPGLYDIQYPVSALSEIIGKPTLWSFLRLGIQNTGIPLPVRCFNSLYEVTHDTTKNMFDQTRIFSGKWLSDDGTWSDLYTICEEILTTFNACIVQADGYWNIVRWGDAYLWANNELRGHAYDENFMNEQQITMLPNFDVITPGTDVELVNANATHRIKRPFKDVIETFNYEQPKQLIKNLDLQTLGEFRQTYTDSDGNTVNEYEIPYWYPQPIGGTPPPDTFIRVIIDPTGIEKERYIVLKGGTFGGSWVFSEFAFINSQDRVNVSMTFRTSDNQVGPSNNTFEMRLIDQTRVWSMNYGVSGRVDGSWENTGGAVYSYTSQQDLHEWTSWNIESIGAPFDGYFQIGLNQLDFDGTVNETHYKDIVFTYIPYINDSVKVIGHVHTDIGPNNVKNNYDEQITIDDSPRVSVMGTLFTNETNWNNRYDNLTTLWGFISDPKNKRLGQYITHERHIIARYVRTLIDCEFVFDCPLLTPMNVMFISSILNLNFIFGVCRFDMMTFRCSATLWELHKDGETGWLTQYNFKYLYQTS